MSDRIYLDQMFEPHQRDGKIIFRKRHDRISSRHLKDLNACVRSQMEGRAFRGHGAKEDEQRVREAFTEATHACSKRGMIHS